MLMTEHLVNQMENSKMIPISKVSFLWKNDIQIELCYIATVLAISNDDWDKIDAVVSL